MPLQKSKALRMSLKLAREASGLYLIVQTRAVTVYSQDQEQLAMAMEESLRSRSSEENPHERKKQWEVRRLRVMKCSCV